jgi:hypothetical protein
MRQSLPSIIRFLLVVVASFILGTVVRLPYASVPSVHDDHYFEWMIGEIRHGRLTSFDAAFTSHSGQMAPIGFLTYQVIFDLFGRNPLPWHLFAGMMQAISAGLLFALLRRYSTSWMGPLLASLLWGACALGRWDNALLWVAMVTTAWGPVLFLFAATATSHLRATYSVAWAYAAALATVCMILAWNATILFLPALLLQWLLLFRETPFTGHPNDASYPAIPRPPAWIWTIGWLIALVLSLVFSVWGLQQATQGVPHRLPPLHHWPTAIMGAISMLAVTASDLTFWTASALATDDLTGKYLVTILLLSGVFFLRPAARSIVLVILTAALTFSLATFLMRQDLGNDFVLTSGRYYSIPILFWCSYIGMVLDGLTSRIAVRSSRLMVGVAATVLLLLHLWHQSRIASLAVKQFDNLWTESIDRFDDQWKTAQRLSEVCARERLRIPEIPIDVPPVKSIYRLSTFSRLADDTRSPHAEFVSIDRLSPDELMRIQRVLGSIDTSSARDWHQTIRSLHEDLNALYWLNDLAKANEENYRLPEVTFHYGDLDVSLDDLLRWAVTEPMTHLKSGGIEDDRERIIDQLIRVDHPFARYWRQRLSTPTDKR